MRSRINEGLPKELDSEFKQIAKHLGSVGWDAMRNDYQQRWKYLLIQSGDTAISDEHLRKAYPTPDQRRKQSAGKKIGGKLSRHSKRTYHFKGVKQ